MGIVVVQLCLTFCDPMDCSTPGFPVLHCLPEFVQIHVQCVNDAIQSSHPLLPSPAFNLSQHQGLFKWVCSLHPKDWSFSFSISPSNEYSGLISFRMDWWISLQSKGLSRVFSNTTVQKHQIFGPQLSLCASLVAQTVKCLPTLQKTWVRSLGRGDSPGEGNSNPLQYSCLENPMDRGTWGLQSMGSQRVRHDWATSLSVSFTFFIVQLSHPYMTTGKTIALTRLTLLTK